MSPKYFFLYFVRRKEIWDWVLTHMVGVQKKPTTIASLGRVGPGSNLSIGHGWQILKEDKTGRCSQRKLEIMENK